MEWILTTVTFLFAQFISTELKCKHGRFGIGCQLKCRCRDRNSDCKGVCKQCAVGYSSPPLCQKENVALNKAVRGSGDINNCHKIVDGDITTPAGLCTKYLTFSPLKMEWIIIDLKFNYHIKSLRLVMSKGRYTGNVSIWSSEKPNSAGNPTHLLRKTELCWRSNKGSMRTMTSSTIEWDVECDVIHRSRYVIIVKDMWSDAINEIFLYYCTPYTFGKDCTRQCNCFYRSEECHRITGACLRGCAAGYQGAGCTTRCSNGTYGVDCKQHCNCKNGAKCDPIYGQCPRGKCNVRYISVNKLCKTTCDEGKFGYPTCQGICRCKRNSSCDVITGECHGDGCMSPRYTGKYCNTTCPDGSYLMMDKCRGVCHCYDMVSCDVAKGSCSRQGCDVGWFGPACQKKCSRHKWGRNCMFRCYCLKELPCNQNNGFCTSGCHHRYLGYSCNQTCPVSMYRKRGECTGRCYCADVDACSVEDGTCYYGSCKPNRKGPKCDDCVVGYYGESCTGVCHCYDDSSCDTKSGHCGSGCRMGWSGDSCQIKLYFPYSVKSVIAISAIITGFVIIEAVLCACCITMKRKRKYSKHHIEESIPHSLHPTFDTLQRRPKESQPPTIDTRHHYPIVSQFPTFDTLQRRPKGSRPSKIDTINRRPLGSQPPTFNNPYIHPAKSKIPPSRQGETDRKSIVKKPRKHGSDTTKPNKTNKGSWVLNNSKKRKKDKSVNIMQNKTRNNISRTFPPEEHQASSGEIDLEL